MRLLIELDDRRETIEADGWAESSTLGDLVAASLGTPLDPGTPLAVDGHRTSSDTPLRDLVLLEGSRVARTTEDPPRTVDGWSVTLAGGLEAGLVVPVPRSRRLVVGRAPQADVVLPTESASWEHCTVEREDDGVRVRDSGSTNGTVIAGERIDDEGVLLTGTTSVIVGGAVLLLRPELPETTVPRRGRSRTSPRPPPHPSTGRPGPVASPTPSRCPRRRAGTSPRRRSSAGSRSRRRSCSPGRWCSCSGTPASHCSHCSAP